MQYVSSLGGPRVMLPSSDVARWIREFDDSPDPDSGLRGLAYSVDDYCGVIAPWKTPLVIFGDDPADMYLVPYQQDALLFRWIGADSQEQLAAFATRIAAGDQWDETLPVTIADSAMTIMDVDTTAEESTPRININLHPGSYVMHSRYAETPEIMTVVHLLKYVG